MLAFMLAWGTLSPQDIPEPLKPLQFLVGAWVGDGVEYRYEWIPGAPFLKAEYSKRSDGGTLPMSTAIFGYDPEKKRLVAFLFGRTGAIGRSECVAEKKDSWVFVGRITSSTSVYEQRQTYTRLNADAYSVQVERKEDDGTYSDSGTYLFKRTPAPSLASEVPKDVAASLRPLGFLIGTWTGEGKMESGEPYTDEHRFEWMHGGRFLYSGYVLRAGGRPRWSSTSIIGYDFEKKRLVAFVFGQSGAIARTECVSDRKDAWIFEGKAVAPGRVVEDRVTHEKVDEDTFRVQVEMKKDGTFAPTAAYVYKRKK